MLRKKSQLETCKHVFERFREFHNDIYFTYRKAKVIRFILHIKINNTCI
jgi:hypothetical protein